MEWIERIINIFSLLTQGMWALLSILLVFTKAKVIKKWMQDFFQKFVAKFPLRNSALKSVFESVKIIFNSRMTKIFTTIIVFISFTGLLFRIDDRFLVIIIVIVGLVFVARELLLKSKRILRNQLLTEIGILIFCASIFSLCLRQIPKIFFKDELIHIVISEFESTSPETKAIAKELQSSINHYLEGSLDSEGIFADAIIVKADTIIHTGEEAYKLGEQQEGEKAIVLWGLIRKDTYTPHYTLINPTKGLVSIETEQAAIFHDFNNLQGTALRLATKALSIASFSFGLVRYWKKGYEPAVVFFEKAYEQDTLNIAIPFYIGNCYYYLNQFERAISAFRKIVEKDPISIPALNNLAVVQLEQNQNSAALELLKRAFKKSGGSIIEVLNNMGVAYKRMNQHDSAMVYFTQATEVGPENPIALHNLALVFAMSGDYATAIKLLERAVKSDEAPARVFTNLGYLYYEHRRNYTDALKLFKKAQTIVSNDTASALGLALVYLNLGDTEEATDWLTKAIENSKSPAKYYQQFGDAAFQAQFYDLALDFYQESLLADPSLTLNYSRMAHCAYQLKREDEALNYVMVYANYNPPDNEETEQTFHLGCVIAYNAGKVDTALTLCERAYRLKPQSKEYHEIYLQTLLHYTFVKKDMGKIPLILQEIESLQPGNAALADYYAQIGNVYWENQVINQAIQYYEKTLSLNPENDLARHNLFISYNNLGNDLLEQRNWDLALTMFDHAFNITLDHKERAKILYRKAYLFQEKGEQDLSRSQLSEFIEYAKRQNIESDEEIRELITNAQNVLQK